MSGHLPFDSTQLTMWPKILLFNIIFLHLILAADVGDRCIPNNDVQDGSCKLIIDCAEAVRSVRKKGHHQYQRCGFSGDQEVVCCPEPADKFGTTESSRSRERVADAECKKILKTTIEPLSTHIIGGEQTTQGEFPHMVAIGFDRGNGLEFDCGGSVVSNLYVLTAAHCIDTLDRIAPSVVRAGVVELGGNEWDDDTDVRIVNITTYPSYTRREKYHDLALLRLEKPLEFSSDLHAICLYTNNQDPSGSLTITGWGQTSISVERKSHVLLKANVSVVSRDKCSESYSNWRKLPRGVSDEQICAGDPEGLMDTCQGDSGGPLIWTANEGQYRLVGITSFGRGCGSPVPGVYTRVYHYLDWIESIVWP